METLLYNSLPLVVSQNQPLMLTMTANQPLDPDTYTVYRLIRDESAAADAWFTINNVRFGYATDNRPAAGQFAADQWPAGFVAAFQAQHQLSSYWHCLAEGTEVLLKAKVAGPVPELTIVNGAEPLLDSFDLENVGEASSELLEVTHPQWTATAWGHSAPRVVDLGPAAGQDHPLLEPGMETLMTSVQSNHVQLRTQADGGPTMSVNLQPLWVAGNETRNAAMLPTDFGLRRVSDALGGLVLAPRLYYTAEGDRQVHDVTQLTDVSNWPFTYVVPTRKALTTQHYDFEGELKPLMNQVDYRLLLPQTLVCGLTFMIVPELIPVELVALAIVALPIYADQQYGEPQILASYTKPEDATLNGLFQFIHQFEPSMFHNLEMVRINLVGIRTDASDYQLIQQGPIFKPFMHLKTDLDRLLALLDDYGHLEILPFTPTDEGTWVTPDLPAQYARLTNALANTQVWELATTEPALQWRLVRLTGVTIDHLISGEAVRFSCQIS